MKFLSHFERVNCPCCKCSIERSPVRVIKEETVYDEKSQRYIRKTSYVTQNRIEEMKNYRVSDFSLDNLTAIGVKLTPRVMQASSDMRNSGVLSYISSIEGQLDKMKE